MECILHIMLWYAWTLQRLSRLCICFVGVGAKKGGHGEKVGRGGAHGGVNVGVVGVWVLFRATCWKCLGDPCVLEMVCGW